MPGSIRSCCAVQSSVAPKLLPALSDALSWWWLSSGSRSFTMHSSRSFTRSWPSTLSEPLSLEQRSTTFLGRPITYLLCVIILLIAWLPYIIYFFPGAVSSDTSRQLAQFFGVNGLSLDTHFPYLMSLTFGGLYQLGSLIDPSGYLGMFLMMLLQVILSIFTFASLVIWLDRLSMRRMVVIGSLAFFALFPLIPVHTVMIEKDTIQAELLVLLTLQIILLFQKKRGAIEQSWLFSPVAVGIVALLVALTRNNGIILVVFALVASALLLGSKRIWTVLGCVIVAMGLWQFAFVPWMGVASEGPREALSMPAQIVSAHIADDLPIAEQDMTTLQDCYDCNLNELADSYNPLLADGAKSQLSIDSPDQLLKYLGTTAHLAIKAPGHALSAALATTYGMWYPFCYGTYHNEDCPYVVAPDSSWASPQWFASYEDLPSMASRTAAGNKLLHALHYLPGLSLLYTPGCYLWLIIFIFGFSLYAKRSRRQTAAALVAFFALALVIVFGPCSSLRYSLPFVFSLPLFIALLILCLNAPRETARFIKEPSYEPSEKNPSRRTAMLIRIAR